MSNIVPRHGSNVTVAGSTAVGRRQLNDQELTLLIGPAVIDRVDAKKTFTAYEVTVELRGKNPGSEIDHERCKALVHIAMNYFLTRGDYDKRSVNRGWKTSAFEYFPVAVPQPSTAVPTPKGLIQF